MYDTILCSMLSCLGLFDCIMCNVLVFKLADFVSLIYAQQVVDE